MRKLIRPAAPSVLQEHSERWNNQWKELKTNSPSAQFHWYAFEKRSARDWILKDLATMTQGHCAFCDRFTVEPESVEHFRPKSDPRFLHLAYSWGNLYFCCGGCQNYKREQWDEGLLNPDADDYVFDRYFAFDFTTGALIPNPAASDANQQRADVTIRLYGLDSTERRRFRLMELRNWQRTDGMELDEFAYRDFVRER